MKILVVTLLYAPDGGPSAPLFSMLCEALAKLGHDVTVIAAVPHYPTGRVDAAYRQDWIQRGYENGVNVIRIRVPSGNRNRLPLRLLQFLIYQLGATVAGLRASYDVLLITNPALEVGIPFAFLSYLRRKPAVFWVADVYPQVGIQLGIFRNKLVIGLVGAMERFCLHYSRYVWIFSDSFRAELRRMGVPESKMVLIYSWVDTEFIKPLARQNGFSDEFQLNDRFVVLYAGNIGLSQDWGDLLSAAQELQGNSDILFVFVGDGTGKGELMERVSAMGLRNVRFIPFQTQERVPEVLASADISVVSLQAGMASGSIPSKIFSYLASGRPLLALLDADSDASKLIGKSGGGIVLDAPEVTELAQIVMRLKQDTVLREQMGRAGRAFIEANHSAHIIARQVEDLLQNAYHTLKGATHAG